MGSGRTGTGEVSYPCQQTSTEPRSPIRVVLADDHAVVRKGIREFLEDDPDIVVVGEARDGQEALRLIDELRPSVAVVDIQMPTMTGIEATRQIKSAFQEVRVLVLTAYEDDPYVFALLRAGADGYLLKSADPDDLVRAVKAIGLELGISDRTVQGHLANIYGKLGVSSRTEAVTKALQLGWIVLEG